MELAPVIALASLGVALAGQLVGTVIWGARLSTRVEHLERWRDDHNDIRQEVAKLAQALDDIKGWLQRVDGRLELITRSVHRSLP